MALLQKAYLGSTALFADKPWFYDLNGIEITGINTSSLTLTAGSPAHTKGSWLELISSTSGTTEFLSMAWQAGNVSGTDTAMLMDIGVGASGSETVVVPDIAIGGASSMTLNLPINIPSGSRIAARLQGVRGSSQSIQTFGNILAISIGGSNAALIPSSLDVLGTDTATSTGTAMSGASGTWVEIVASTSDDYIGFQIIPSFSDSSITTYANTVYTLGVGAAGSEVAIGDISINYNGANESVALRTINVPLFGQEVPAGSRLAVKHNLAANPDKYDACIIAIPKV